MTSRFNRISGGRRGLAVIVGTLCAIAIAPSSASATTSTLHLFANTTDNTFTNPSGHPILGHVPPPPRGSILTNTGTEYLGTFKRHAHAASASTDIVCFVTRAPTALCYGQIAVGGSMLLANRFTANLAQSNPFASIPINAGTGKFAGAHGTIHTALAGRGNGVNFTITYTA